MDLKKKLTKDEMRRLLILTYLGEWMMTSFYRDESRSEYTGILDKVLSLAHQMGLDEYVSWQETPRRIQPSSLLEQEGQRFIDEYGDKFFLDELADRLSQIKFEDLLRYQKERPEIS